MGKLAGGTEKVAVFNRLEDAQLAYLAPEMLEALRKCTNTPYRGAYARAILAKYERAGKKRK